MLSSDGNNKNVLIDLIPLIYLIRSKISNEDSSESINHVVKNIKELLCILDSHYGNFEKLDIVQYVNNILLNHLSIDTTDVMIKDNDNQDILIDNFLQCRGIEPIRHNIVHIISQSISMLESHENEELLKQSSFLPIISTHKKQKSSGYFTSFDFDNLPDYEPLENTLQLIRSGSENDTAIQKLMVMDLEELFEHPQWSELIEILQKYLIDLTNIITDNYRSKILLLYLKYIETFRGNFQGIDVINKLLKYLTLQWINMPYKSIKKANEFYSNPITEGIDQFSEINKVQIVIFLKVFDIFAKNNSISSNQKETDTIITMIFLLISKGFVPMIGSNEYISIFRVIVMFDNINDSGNSMKYIMNNYHPLSVISHANSCGFLSFIINIISTEYDLLSTSRNQSNDNICLNLITSLLLATKYLLHLLSPFSRNIIFLSNLIARKDVVPNLEVSNYIDGNIDDIMEPVMHSNKRFYHVGNDSIVFNLISLKQSQLDLSLDNNIIFDVFMKIIEILHKYVNIIISGSLPDVNNKPFKNNDIAQIIKSVLLFCHYDSAANSKLVNIIASIHDFNLKYISFLSSKIIVNELQTYLSSLFHGCIVIIESMGTSIHNNNNNNNDNHFIQTLLKMIYYIEENFSEYISSQECQRLSLTLCSAIMNLKLGINNNIYINILSRNMNKCFAYIDEKLNNNNNNNNQRSKNQIDDKLSYSVEFILNISSNVNYISFYKDNSPVIISEILNILIDIISEIIIFNNSQLSVYLSQTIYSILNISSLYGKDLFLTDKSLHLLSEIIRKEHHQNYNIWDYNTCEYYNSNQFSIIFNLFTGWIFQDINMNNILLLWISLIQSECCDSFISNYQPISDVIPNLLFSNIDELMSYGITLYFIRLIEISFIDQNYCLRCGKLFNKLLNVTNESNNNDIDITNILNSLICYKLQNIGFSYNMRNTYCVIPINCINIENYKIGNPVISPEGSYVFNNYYDYNNMKFLIPWDSDSVTLNNLQNIIDLFLENYQNLNINIIINQEINESSDLIDFSYFSILLSKMYKELYFTNIPDSNIQRLCHRLKINNNYNQINYFLIFCGFLVRFDDFKLTILINKMSEKSNIYKTLITSDINILIDICLEGLKKFEMIDINNICKSIGIQINILIRKILNQWFLNFLCNEDIVILTALTVTKGIVWPVLTILSLLKYVVKALIDNKDVHISYNSGGIELFYKVLRSHEIKLIDLIPFVNELYNSKFYDGWLDCYGM